MKILKENVVLLVFSSFALFIFLALLLISSNVSSEIEDLKDDIDKEVSKRSSIKETLSAFANLDSDFKTAHLELSKLSDLDKKQRAFWKSILNARENHFEKWTDKTPESVNADITRLFTTLRSRCAAAEVGLPAGASKSPTIGFGENNAKPKNNYGFGFSSYDGFWPSFTSEEAKILGIQAKIVKELVEFITQSSTDSQSLSIVEILREPAGKIDTNHIERDRLELNSERKLLIRQPNVVDTFVFRITLNGQTKHARSFINKLRSPFLLRNFSVERDILETAIEEQTLDFAPNPFGDSVDPLPEKKVPLPIVKDVNSEFSFLIEYVTSIRIDVESIGPEIKGWGEFDEELLSEFLTASGNSEKIEEIISLIQKSE